MTDLRDRGVDILTLGQYLQPTANHLPVRRLRSPGPVRGIPRAAGWRSGSWRWYPGPLVRSSYRAERALEQNNVGL